MNKVYPTNRALNMLPEYKSIFIGKFLFLWNNTLYINTASIFHRAKVNQQSFPFSFSISLLFLKLLRTEPVSVKSSFTFDMLLSAFILYPARALRALGLLLADGTPTVGGGKTF